MSPGELVQKATEIGLEALAISDHDTLAGYDAAAPHARRAGLDLVCGIELSTKLHGKTVHLLGYFLNGNPMPEFRAWLADMQASRRDRNERMAARLRSLGIDITLDEVERRGRTLTGRPHFAKLMLEKGYVSSIQQAFDEYLDESAQAYVDRREPELAEAIRRISEAGGLASVAHPVRMGYRTSDRLHEAMGEMREMGLGAIEVYHSDHRPADVERYLALAREYGLAVTGGSDFHGDAKPGVQLGRGSNGNLNIPRSVLDRLREL